MLTLGIAVPCAAVALVIALLRRHSVTVGVNEHTGVVGVARTTRAWRVLGLLAGLLAAGLLLVLGDDLDALGRLTALAPTALGTGVLLGTIVGELSARPNVGIRRSAAVETRRVRAVVPPGRTGLLGGAVTALGGLLLVGTAWGAPDDRGRPGRWFAVECSRVVGGVTTRAGGAHGPWPGSFYAVPIGLALAVLLLLVLVALRAVVRRGSPGLESRGLDTLLRRWSVGNVLTAATFAVLATLGPVAGLVAAALAGPACAPTPAEVFVRWASVGLGVLAWVGAAATLGMLVSGPTIRVDDLPRPTPGDAAPVGAPVR